MPGGCCSGEKYDPENNNRLHIKIQLYWTLYFGSSCMVGCVENNQLATTNERRTHITRVQTRVSMALGRNEKQLARATERRYEVVCGGGDLWAMRVTAHHSW